MDPVTHPELTIITISRDDPDGLAATLESVARQAAIPAELIVIRRGRSGIVDISSTGAASKSGGAVIPMREVTDPGTGISAAFNAGILAARGEWLVFLNGGDTLLDDRSLASIKELCQSSPAHIDIVAGFAITDRATTIPRQPPFRPTDYLYLSHQAAAFRRRAFDEIGNYDVTFRVRMDLDWLARHIARHGIARILFFSKPLVRYRLDGISSRSLIRFYVEEIRALSHSRKFFGRLLLLWLRDIPARMLIPHAWHQRLVRVLGSHHATTGAASRGAHLYFDCSFTRLHESNIGITRVVRKLATALLRQPPFGMTTKCVAFSPAGLRVCEPPHLPPTTKSSETPRRSLVRKLLRLSGSLRVRRFVRTALSVPVQALAWRVFSNLTYGRAGRALPLAAIAPGDIILLCDASWNYDIWPCVRRAKTEGAQVVTMIHDLIPLHHPEFCPSLLPPIFRRWLNGAIEHSDVLMCNSRATHEDLETYCRTADLPCPPAASFRLGDDLPSESVCEQPVRPTIVRIAAEIPRQLFLCVGSIEPRKNHAVVLDAFDALWARNTCLNLLIAGRPADGADAIFERIRTHPMRGKRLFYHGDCNDAELDYLYRHANALIFASHAEGFGLPLVEARQRGCRVIASHIPAFRELADGGVFLFDQHSAEQLMQCILQLSIDAPGKQHTTAAAGFSWRESSDQLLDRMLRLLPRRTS